MPDRRGRGRIRELRERRLKCNFRWSVGSEIARFVRLPDAGLAERGERDHVVRFFFHASLPARNLSGDRIRRRGRDGRRRKANKRAAKDGLEAAEKP